MIDITSGDILRADAEALVNTVNCVGVMGRGIALQFKKAFPDNFDAYKKACDNGELVPGKMLVVDLDRLAPPRCIINFPTKRHWRSKSRIEDVESGLTTLVAEVRARNIASIAVPPLGCGLGGLDWAVVRPMIERAFEGLSDVHVLLYEPTGAPAAEKMAKTKTVPRMTEGRAALLVLMRRYLSAVMDPWVTLLEIHKLMYFMQEAGEPLRLTYVRGPYGPYAENLRHVLNAIEGHFITGYADAEDDPTRSIELNLDTLSRANAVLAEHPNTHRRFDRVANLIEGFETTYGLELLATVHWIGRYESPATVDETIAKVHAWNDRKKMFSEEHIRLASIVLKAKGWRE